MSKIEDCLPEIREIWSKMMLEACWIVFAWGPISFKEPHHIGKKGALSSILWFCNFGAPNVFITVLAADLLRPELHRHTVCLHRMIHMFLQVFIRHNSKSTNNNPAITAWYFQKRFQLFFDHV